MADAIYTINTLAALTGLSIRTIRYYIQQGLLDHPQGEKRGAHYTETHLKELQTIRVLTEKGFSLTRIRSLITEESEAKDPVEKVPGTISVISHMYLAPGIELTIDPHNTTLTPDQTRKLIQIVTQGITDLTNKNK